jgi:hypothetical protein
LDQNIQHVAILIHGSPEVMALTTDGEINLVKVPRITWLGASGTTLIGRMLAELATPLGDGVVGHCTYARNA